MNKTYRQKRNRKQKRSRRQNRQSASAAAIVGRSVAEDLRFRTPLFPPRFRKKLVYCEVGLSVTGAAGIAGNYFFAANGCYDPNITGVGHQPMGFDQMMLMYEHYTVVASKISLTVNNGSGAGITSDFGIFLAPDTTVLTNPSLILENGYCATKPLAAINVAGYMKSLNFNCDVAAYFSRDRKKRELVGDDQLSGTAAANPAELVYYGVCAFDRTGASNTVLVYFCVDIEYDVIFWEPRKLIQS